MFSSWRQLSSSVELELVTIDRRVYGSVGRTMPVGSVIEYWTSRTKEASAGRSDLYASDRDRRTTSI